MATKPRLRDEDYQSSGARAHRHGASGFMVNKNDYSPEQIDDPVEYHYKFALKLRPNFALAALNLGAWKLYADRGWLNKNAGNKARQLEEAERILVSDCAIQMKAEAARNFNQHVRAQIECLISGARVHLEALEQTERRTNVHQDQHMPNIGESDGHSHDGRSSGAAAAALGPDGETKQTMRSTRTAGDGGPDEFEQTFDRDRLCSKITHWMRMAREKAQLIGLAELADGPQARVEEAASLGLANLMTPRDRILFKLSDGHGLPFGDLGKQLATVNWIQSKCSVAHDQTRTLLQAANSLSVRSRYPAEATIYLDYAGLFPSKKETLSQAFDAELSKFEELNDNSADMEEIRKTLVHNLATLLDHLSREERTKENIRASLGRAEKAIALSGKLGVQSDRLHTLAGELSYDLGEALRSEHFYRRALELLETQANSGGGDGKGKKTSRGEQKSLCSPGNDQQKVEGVPRRKSSEQIIFCQRLSKAHTNYGAILQVNGHLREAEEHYRQALAFNPGNSIAATNLKRITP